MWKRISQSVLLNVGSWLLVVGLFLSMTGCLYLPIPGPREGRDVDDDVLESFLGKPLWELMEVAGIPEEASDDLVVYREGSYFGHVLVIAPWRWSVGATGDTIICHVFELDSDEVIVDYETYSSTRPMGTARELHAGELRCSEEFEELNNRGLMPFVGSPRWEARLKALSPADDPKVAYELYFRLKMHGYYAAKEKSPGEFDRAWYWLCPAANQGYALAQSEVAFWFRTSTWEDWAGETSSWLGRGIAWLQSRGMQPDDRVAYMWYTLAAESDPSFSFRKALSAEMTPEQIAQAEQMARDWKPGDCPSAEHRLEAPGDT